MRVARPVAGGRRAPPWLAAWALARCVARTLVLLATGALHQPRAAVGRTIAFADGTSAAVYRETTVDRTARDPAFLVVTFRLRRVRSGRIHAAFRAESVLNTALFAGFPGFASKLWLAHDQDGRYRGVYEWDGIGAAERYVRVLWWPLALISDTASIDAVVVGGVRRDEALADPTVVEVGDAGGDGWWRPTTGPGS